MGYCSSAALIRLAGLMSDIAECGQQRRRGRGVQAAAATVTRVRERRTATRMMTSTAARPSGGDAGVMRRRRVGKLHGDDEEAADVIGQHPHHTGTCTRLYTSMHTQGG